MKNRKKKENPTHSQNGRNVKKGGTYIEYVNERTSGQTLVHCLIFYPLRGIHMPTPSIMADKLRERNREREKCFTPRFDCVIQNVSNLKFFFPFFWNIRKREKWKTMEKNKRKEKEKIWTSSYSSIYIFCMNWKLFSSFLSSFPNFFLFLVLININFPEKKPGEETFTNLNIRKQPDMVILFVLTKWRHNY
mgnify:CR=1 FL=1